MNILVTGGSGLVGAAVRRLALETDGNNWWHFVNSQDADLRDLQQTLALFERVRPTHVLHLAARVGGLYYNMRDNVGFFRDNMLMQDNVCQCCLKLGVQRMVSVLSTCIFPDGMRLPLTEEDLHMGPPHKSNAGYAHAKRMMHVQCELYNEQYGCDFVSVIPTNAYGEGDNFHLQDAHVVPALIHRCFLAKQAGSSFEVAGSGKPLRQFIYAADLACMLRWALLHYSENKAIILADEREHSIREVAEFVAEAMDFQGDIVFDTSLGDGQMRKTVSTEKLKSHMPHHECVGLRKGIKKTVEWFRSNYQSARK